MSHFEIINDKLEKIFSQSPYSITEIANTIGIDKSTLSRILSGKIKKPSQEVIEKLSDFFGVSQNEIIKSNRTSENHGEYIKFESTSDIILFFMKEYNIFEITDFSNLCNISISEMTKIINNNRINLSLEITNKISDFIGITPSELLCEKPINIYKIQKLKSDKSGKNCILDIKELDEKIRLIFIQKNKFESISISSSCFFKDNENNYGRIMCFTFNFHSMLNRLLIGFIDNKIAIFEIHKKNDVEYLFFPDKEKSIKKINQKIEFIGKLSEIKF